jgi:NAD(P)-dependent dehydrogenase (short-subunit alcohol dehydrogenase family)
MELEGMDLDGKVAVVTGASTGIGRATATAFASRGMKVVLAARRIDRLEAAVGELRADGFDAVGVATDVADLEQVRHLAAVAYDEFGRVDVAFFNAGSPSADRVVDPDLDVWNAAIGTNVLGLLHGLKAFLPRMLHDGAECSVLATTSGAGIHGTAYDTAPYAATKAAQLSILESLYGQARDQHLPLHVGVVVPPLTRTNLAGDDLSIWGHVVDGLATRGIPAALIEPEEVAQVVVEGLERRAFWIEAGVDEDARYFGGRNRDTIARNHEIIRAKAESMIGHTAPDGYLW